MTDSNEFTWASSVSQWVKNLAGLQEPQEVFRSALLHSVLASPEYRSRLVLLTDCPLPVASAVPQLTVAASVQGLPPRLIRLYRMLPPFLQRLAKRIAGKE